MVYFIQQGTDGPIKIGKTSEPWTRLRELQCANPDDLRMLGVLEGGRDLEGRLHHEFRQGHIRGEWFRADTPGLRRLIRTAKRPLGRPRGGLCESCYQRPVGPCRKRFCDHCDPRGPVDEQQRHDELAAAMEKMFAAERPVTASGTETPDGIPLGRAGFRSVDRGAD